LEIDLQPLFFWNDVQFGRKKKKFRKKGGDSQSEDEDGLKGKANERNVEDEVR